ncbi:hypothetical protein D3C76_665890 [compost metagenome]
MSNNPLIYSDPSGHMITRGADSIGSDGGSSGAGLEFKHFSDMNQFELTQIMGDARYSSGVRGAAAAEFVKRNFMLVENGAVKAASGVQALINSAKKALRAGEVVQEVKSVISTTRVGQWMSKAEYADFVKNGIIPRTNVLTDGMEGYMKQANKGDYYVEFDIDSTLLLTKDLDLGWSMVKSKNSMQLKLAKQRGISLPDPIGTNIKHIFTKGE